MLGLTKKTITFSLKAATLGLLAGLLLVAILAAFKSLPATVFFRLPLGLALGSFFYGLFVQNRKQASFVWLALAIFTFLTTIMPLILN